MQRDLDMLAALDWYADQLCEGYCEQAPEWAGFDDDVCAGCLARRAAAKARGLPYAQAIEARSVETTKIGSIEDESAVGSADAPCNYLKPKDTTHG